MRSETRSVTFAATEQAIAEDPKGEPSEHSVAASAEQASHDCGHHDDGASMQFYLPPLQRQRWGQEQILPHTDWGDLFFDLFYVAA